MKLDLQHNFRLELMICIALSKVKFSEYNDLTIDARKLVSYEFPEDMEISINDLVKIIVEFRNHNYQTAELFTKNFARKDPDRFRILASDQAKPFGERKYHLGNFANKVLAIATLYNIDYSYSDVKSLL